MRLPCRQPGRACLHLLFCLAVLFFYNEFLIYYATLLRCSWPSLSPAGATGTAGAARGPLRAMILADTHLLGPFRGHPWDKLRREWQMERSFQTALTLFDPEVIFLLGDVFDEGHWVDADGWKEYLRRFRSIFRRSESVPMVVVPGNHDIGFHYHLNQHPFLNTRFKDVYDSRGRQVSSLTLKGVNFVLLNSMAFEGDDCSFCKKAKTEMKRLAEDLRCARNKTACGGGASSGGTGRRDRRSSSSTSSSTNSSSPSLTPSRPVVLQHFPLFRRSDALCSEPDEAPAAEKEAAFREKWDCVSAASTRLILEALEPRLVVSGHTHHGCLTRHRISGGDGGDDVDDNDSNNNIKNNKDINGNILKIVPEYSVSSFSWRNRNNPAFLLAVFSPENYAVSKCLLPEESSVINNYVGGSVLALLWAACLCWPWRGAGSVWGWGRRRGLEGKAVEEEINLDKSL